MIKDPFESFVTVFGVWPPVIAFIGGLVAAALQIILFLRDGDWPGWTVRYALEYTGIDPTTGWLGFDRLVDTTNITFGLFIAALLWFFAALFVVKTVVD